MNKSQFFKNRFDKFFTLTRQTFMPVNFSSSSKLKLYQTLGKRGSTFLSGFDFYLKKLLAVLTVINDARDWPQTFFLDSVTKIKIESKIFKYLHIFKGCILNFRIQIS